MPEFPRNPFGPPKPPAERSAKPPRRVMAEDELPRRPPNDPRFPPGWRLKTDKEPSPAQRGVVLRVFESIDRKDYAAVEVLKPSLEGIPGIECEFRPMFNERVSRYIRNLDLVSAEELASALGMRPDYYGACCSAIQDAYLRIIESERQPFQAIDMVTAITSVLPYWFMPRFEAAMHRIYGRLIRSEQFEEIRRWEQETLHHPDWGRHDGVIQDLYADHLRAGNLRRMKQLQEYTHVIPAYRSQLSSALIECSCRLIREYRLTDLSSIRNYVRDCVSDKPEYRGAFQEAYAEAIVGGIDLASLRSIELSVGVRMERSEKIIEAAQKRYADLICYGNFLTLGVLLEELSIPLDRTRQDVKDAIEEALRDAIVVGAGGTLREIKQYTGVEPDFHGAHKAYATAFFRSQLDSCYFSGVKAAAAEFGINPDYAGEFRQPLEKMYRTLVRGQNFSSIREVIQTTGVRPDFAGALRPTVMRAYVALLRIGDFTALQEGIDVTNIIPDWQREIRSEVVQRYRICLREKEFGPLAALQEMTGVAPDFKGELRQDVEVAYGASIRNGCLADLQKLEELSGIPIDWERFRPAVEKIYKKWTVRGSFDPIAVLAERSGIKPDYSDPRLQEKIQAVYGRHLEGWSYSSPEGWRDLPPYELEGVRMSSDEEKLRNIKERTGVAPDYAGELRGRSSKVIENILVRIPWEKPELSTRAKLALEEAHRASSEFGIALWDEGVWRSQLMNSVLIYSNVEAIPARVANFLKQFPQPEARVNLTQALRLCLPILMGRGNYSIVTNCVKLVGILPEDALVQERVMVELSRGAIPADLLQLMIQTKTRFEIGPEQFDRIPRHDPRTVAILLKYGLPKEKEARAAFIEHVRSKGGIYEIFPDLVELRGPAARIDFCPYEQQLKPLIGALAGRGYDQSSIMAGQPKKGDVTAVYMIDERGNRIRMDEKRPMSSVESQGVLKFVRHFGMNQLPKLMNVMIDLEVLRDRVTKLEQYPATAAAIALPRMNPALSMFWSAHGLRERAPETLTSEEIDVVIQELEQVMGKMKQQILDDELPNGLEHSPLDMELFNAVVERGANYGAVDDRPTLIWTWRNALEAAEERRDQARVPDGYTKKTYFIRSKQTADSLLDQLGELNADVRDEAAIAKQAKIISELRMALEAVSKKEPYVKFIEPFNQAVCGLAWKDALPGGVEDPQNILSDTVTRLTAQLHEKQEELRKTDQGTQAKKHAGLTVAVAQLEGRIRQAEILGKPGGIQWVLQAEEDRLAREYEVKESDVQRTLDAEGDERKRASKRSAWEGWKVAQMERMSTIRDLLTEISGGEAEAAAIPELRTQRRYARVQATLEALRISFGKDVMSVAGMETRMLILELMSLESPNHIKRVKDLQGEAPGAVSRELQRAWEDVVTDELVPHFANPKQPHAETRKIPFTPELFVLIENIWKITQIREKLQGEFQHFGKKGHVSDACPKHSLTDTMFEARSLEEKLEEATAGKRKQADGTEGSSVTFHPCHGLARILSGDIANACFDKLRQRLARNEFPRLQAITMSEGEGSALRIIGNFLLIEAAEEAEDAEKALVIRALNPHQKVVGKELRADDILDKAIEYAIDVARARNLDQVRLCLDGQRGGHASNVQVMFDTMTRIAAKNGWPTGKSLRATDETTFNGHQIWMPGQTRIVWTKKKAAS